MVTQRLNTGRRFGLVTALCAAIFAGPVLSDTKSTPKRSIAVDAQSQTVRLMVKRASNRGDFKWERLTVPAADLERVMAELLSDPDVLAVESDARVSVPRPAPSRGPVIQRQSTSMADTLLYDDPHFNLQRYFTEGDEFNSQLEPTHRRLTSTNRLRVGVIDSGFYRANDLNYVEGYNFNSDRGPAYIVGEGVDCFIDPTFGDTNTRHGSEVSHIIGATVNNALGIAGVGRNADVVAARALGCRGTGFVADVSDAVVWLAGGEVEGVPPISEPVDVINMSLGGEGQCLEFEQDAISFAVEQGIAVIVSAGNDASDAANQAPANCEGVITVGANDAQGRISTFSNSGLNVDITAQGTLTATATPESDVQYVNGTSFSAPIVAGAVAFLLAERPDTTLEQLNAYIAQSGKPVNGSDGLGLGAGILDGMKLLDAAGVPRERFGVQLVVDGERARFAEALAHPKTTAYFVANDALPACDVVEIDTTPLGLGESTDPLTVFSVPMGQPLIPTEENALLQTDRERFLLEKSFFDAPRDYGYARCDIATGSNCNQVETIRGLDVSRLTTPAVCQTDEVLAAR